jgi:hypothetical protein
MPVGAHWRKRDILNPMTTTHEVELVMSTSVPDLKKRFNEVERMREGSCSGRLRSINVPDLP